MAEAVDEQHRHRPELLWRLNHTVDRLAYRIDYRIRPVIYLLWDLGIEPTASCEGHRDHGLPYPWFDLAGHQVIHFGLPCILYGLDAEIGFTRYYCDQGSLPTRRGTMLRQIKQFYTNHRVSHAEAEQATSGTWKI